MKLSTQSRYGVRAIFDIAYNSTHSPAQIKDICRRQKIPPRYLEQIFQKLKKNGFLESKRGPKGGYMLKKSPEKITVGEVIRSLESQSKIVFCIEIESGKKKCPFNDKCVTQKVWKEAYNRIFAYFNSITIADLCKMAKEMGIKQEIGHQLSFAI
jgi:Rrf2 family protein